MSSILSSFPAFYIKFGLSAILLIMETIIKLFAYYKHLGESAILQLTDEQLFEHTETHSNSIPLLVKHLWGNMLSRWTDFLETDGEKDWRKRDEEFVDTIENRAHLTHLWETGWACLFDSLGNLTPSDLIDRKVRIRNQEHSVMDAIQRQLAHYAYHVGQIVYIAKDIKGEDWNSLSIPKNGSQQFNKNKFLNKQSGHFTDDFISS